MDASEGTGRLGSDGTAVRSAARGRVALAQRRCGGPKAAERAGHEVDVLLKVYAKCIDGR
ncbi:hypothetical protein [Streptosporangium sp. NPDC003464]